MERQVIIIPTITKEEPDYRKISLLTGILDKLEKEYGKDYIETGCSGLKAKLIEEKAVWEEYRQPRINLWKSMLGKYWKLTIVGRDGKEMEWGYVYPYQMRLDNETVFALLSGIGDLNGYKSGVQESSMGMFDFYHWCDLRFEEASREEMEANALTSSVNVIEYRLKRQQEKLETGEVDEEGVTCTQMSTMRKDFRMQCAKMVANPKFAEQHKTVGEIIPIEGEE